MPEIHEKKTMKKELDDLLCRRYPDIFRDRHGDAAETGMCQGICVGDGWFDLIDSLCAELSNQVAAGKMPPVVALQVKQKSGYLRFYIRDHFKRDTNPQAHRLIGLAQQKAEHTCEQCGQPAPPRALDYGEVLCLACTADQFKGGGTCCSAG